MIDTCSTCSHWRQEAPAIATATRRITADPNLGACQAYSPAVLLHAGIPITYWPETHGDRTCGEWLPSGPHDPDGGGEELTNVVPLRGAA